VEQLLANGQAYFDYARPEEINAQREAAQKQKRHFVYDRHWMAETDEARSRFEAEGRERTVRLKMPRDGVLKIDDMIRGTVEFEWSREQDHVIQRADGSCLYHLATVVDDFHFQITHVIRAEEHLSNTPRQMFIARSLGFPIPRFAHLPYVAEPGSRNKLSKRKLSKYLKHPDFGKLNEQGRRIMSAIGREPDAETFNPVIVDFYEQTGYLPDAITNYLLLLGWSLDDRTELFTREEMIRLFSLERVNKAPASFDPAKLVSFQEKYVRRLPIKRKVALAVPFLQKAGYITDPPSCDTAPKVSRVLQAADDRIVAIGDILEFAEMFIDDEALTFDTAALDKRLRRAPESLEALVQFRAELSRVGDFQANELEHTLRSFVDSRGMKMGQIVHALRVAVTGKSVGFGIFEALEILGRESSLRRIDRAIAVARESS
jgi:glutamyl-tRNA synthetase